MIVDSLYFQISLVNYLLNLFVHSSTIVACIWFLTKYIKNNPLLKATALKVVLIILIFLPILQFVNFNIWNSFLRNVDSFSFTDKVLTDTAKPSPTTSSNVSSKNKEKSENVINNHSIKNGHLLKQSLNNVNWLLVLGIAWLTGTAFFLFRLFFSLVFLSGYRSGLSEISNPEVDRILKDAQTKFNISRQIHIFISPTLSTPVCTGIFKPALIFPSSLFNIIDINELESILFHEIGHLHGRDQILGLIQKIACSFYWWNPLIYLLSGKYSEERVIICDNYAIQGLKSPDIYAECLIGLASKTRLKSILPATVGMASSRIALEKRITQIMTTKRAIKVKFPKMVTMLFVGCILIFEMILSGFNVAVANIPFPQHFNEVVFNDPEEVSKDFVATDIYNLVLTDSHVNELLELINKRHVRYIGDKTFEALCYFSKAAIKDYATIQNNIPELKTLDDSEIENFNNWLKTNVSHSQQIPNFQDEPDKISWLNIGSIPSSKKMLPSEMRALKLYTNKISGEGTSMMIMFMSMLRNNGLSSENVLCLRLSGNSVLLLFKFNNNLYLIDDNGLSSVDKVGKVWLSYQTFNGVFNDSLFHTGKLKIDRLAFFKGDSLRENISLVELLEKYCTINFSKVHTEDTAFNKLKTDYCTQLLSVPLPGIYIDASILQPLTIRLAKELTSTQLIIHWMKENLNYGSIFNNCGKRIMVSDQIILYKTGTAKDRAILFASLMKLNKHFVSISITDQDAFVKVDNKNIYSMELLAEVPQVKGTIVISILNAGSNQYNLDYY